ncbi:helix-turn-helix domain-containing protein [Beduinella massiliensis]|uniref:helix-turn-helix domain-containing protein n=1 Tax=Beduinella massiliensis TaxID=1852363 RepID=UPI003D1539AF
MNVALAIQEKLKDLRTSRGLNLEQLAEQTGISRSALGQYETDEYKDVSHTSIVTLAKFYGVSTDYRLGMTEIKSHSNADLADLHLSDDMIEL